MTPFSTLRPKARISATYRRADGERSQWTTRSMQAATVGSTNWLEISFEAQQTIKAPAVR
ncbi:hypothetical protein GCM10023081_20160 [Arthrobacter ginkgonis]|uniref:Uncharacterized protein n=1 Tax=Arthrobacter ginkgonis TaxID=1630594 RepID=A0ABP7CAC8_9MICC